tara:strand:+ start:40 stop:228 length:189 start_codon:yes stop_codon:yes gene_type:complete
MKVGDLVKLSKKAQKQKQNQFICNDDIGFVCRDIDSDNLFYVKWFRRSNETMHYRYELRFAK